MLLRRFFIVAAILVMFSVVTLICASLVFAIIEQYGEFEYATSSGETGTASFCTVSYGQSRCRTEDGTSIMVEKYTKK